MIKNNPKVTVLIPTFNRSEYLNECLDSLMAQTLPAVQIIVINDGSTDGTKEICASYGTAIEYYELNHLGKPSAINFGLSQSRGDYIWIFDDDDVAYPNALERFVDPLEKNPGYGFSFSTFNYSTTDVVSKRIGSIMYELSIPDLNNRGFLIPLMESNFLGGAALFARRSCYQEIGIFDSALLRSQDYEMAIRIARRFKGIRVQGGATFHYRQHEGDRGAKQDRFTIKERLGKWVEYNQKFFTKFYRDLPLVDYLPPGVPLQGHTRQAIIQRMAIMSYKLLTTEVLQDLGHLTRCNELNPMTPQEYLIIRAMIVKDPRQIQGGIYEQWEFFKEIKRLAGDSKEIRLLRGKVVRAIVARYLNDPQFNEIPGAIGRLIRLYI